MTVSIIGGGGSGSAAASPIVDNITILSLLGERTIAQINALSPARGDAVICTDFGTPTAGDSDGMSPGDVCEFDGVGWERIQDNVIGRVPTDFRAVVDNNKSGTFSPFSASEVGKIVVAVVDPGTFDGSVSDWNESESVTDGDRVFIDGISDPQDSVLDGRELFYSGNVPVGAWLESRDYDNEIDDFTHPDLIAYEQFIEHCYPMSNLTGTTQEDSVGGADLTTAGGGGGVVFGANGPAGRQIRGEKGRYSMEVPTNADFLRASAGVGSWGAGDFTISGWYQIMNNTTSSRGTFSNPLNNNYLQIAQLSSIPGFLVQATPGGGNSLITRAGYGRWVYVVITRDVSSGDLLVYVNGVRQITETAHSTQDYTGYDIILPRRDSLSNDTVGSFQYIGEWMVLSTIVPVSFIHAAYNGGRGRFHG